MPSEVDDEISGLEQQVALEFPLEQEHTAATLQSEHVFDEIPAPAYQPQGEELDTLVVEEPAPLVATQNVRGTPSPEAMARLRAAVERVPGTGPRTSNEPMMTPSTPPKSKFGINSLINRMTGHTESIERSGIAAPSQVGGQAFEADEAGNEADERIEIPAFLRRQAN